MQRCVGNRGKRGKGYSAVGRRGVSSNGVIGNRGKRGKGYSAVGRRGVRGNGVIVVLEVREERV